MRSAQAPDRQLVCGATDMHHSPSLCPIRRTMFLFFSLYHCLLLLIVEFRLPFDHV